MTTIKGPITISKNTDMLDILKMGGTLRLPFTGTNISCTQNQELIPENMRKVEGGYIAEFKKKR